jgi:hypothetical protein
MFSLGRLIVTIRFLLVLTISYLWIVDFTNLSAEKPDELLEPIQSVSSQSNREPLAESVATEVHRFERAYEETKYRVVETERISRENATAIAFQRTENNTLKAKISELENKSTASNALVIVMGLIIAAIAVIALARTHRSNTDTSPGTQEPQ